jgi:hypothetical protein
MRYFKCIDNSNIGSVYNNALSNGKIYEKLESQRYYDLLYILDNNGEITGWYSGRFIEVTNQVLRKKKLDEIL